MCPDLRECLRDDQQCAVCRNECDRRAAEATTEHPDFPNIGATEAEGERCHSLCWNERKCGGEAEDPTTACHLEHVSHTHSRRASPH